MKDKGIMSKATFWGLVFFFVATNVFGQQTEIRYLSGRDKDHTVKWDFYLTHGWNSGKWTTIPVPSQWELQGFGSYHYGTVEPFDSVADERGIYKHDFTVPDSWKNKNIFIVFDGSMTDTQVEVNGQSAGPIHQGAFYQFKYDITPLIKIGDENSLKVTVSKISADSSVNRAERRADYWVFGGIFRPVYLQAFPKEFIKRLAIDAKANGSFKVETFLSNINNADRVDAQIFNLDGEKIGHSFSAKINAGQQEVTLQTKIDHPKTWNPESPRRYQIRLQLMQGDQVLHKTKEKFGFRTVEVRKGDGIYVNGQRVMLKGVDRHSFWPSSGRTTSKEISIMDVNMIKDMNMNAVRMSHYPPDSHFLNVCDSLGLFVLDELAGWQASYDTGIGEKLVKETVIRDVNHPSIVFWDNGNEGGFNRDLDDDYAKYDPQERTVLHPWEKFGGIDTDHYESYGSVQKKLSSNTLFMPTEFLHGLYDGGHGAGLHDYWKLMQNSPEGAGGFLWALIDEGVVRTDQHGRIDVHGNNAPDGILSPYRKKEASYYTIRDIWSWVQIQKPDLTSDFTGNLQVENQFFYTNLDQCSFEWQLVDFPGPFSHLSGYDVAEKGTFKAPDVAPQQQGKLTIDLPDNWKTHDALFIKAKDPHGRLINKWTWMITSHGQKSAEIVTQSNQKAIGEDVGDAIIMEGGSTMVKISKSSGQIVSMSHNHKPISFNHGPRLVEDSARIVSISSHLSGDNFIVEAKYEEDKKWVQYTMDGKGWLTIRYKYTPSEGAHKYLGVTFDYPSHKVNAVKWLGQGPYRVWKNRMQGMKYGVWSNRYNDTKTGQEWNYPEFKGNFADLYWAQIQTKEQPITVVSDTRDVFFRLLTPSYGIDPRHTAVDFPSGDISFLQAIAPIGTKFKDPKELGPQGQPTMIGPNAKPVDVTLHFYFGEME